MRKNNDAKGKLSIFSSASNARRMSTVSLDMKRKVQSQWRHQMIKERTPRGQKSLNIVTWDESRLFLKSNTLRQEKSMKRTSSILQRSNSKLHGYEDHKYEIDTYWKDMVKSLI